MEKLLTPKKVREILKRLTPEQRKAIQARVSDEFAKYQVFPVQAYSRWSLQQTIRGVEWLSISLALAHAVATTSMS
jgi:hypothetical protein